MTLLLAFVLMMVAAFFAFVRVKVSFIVHGRVASVTTQRLVYVRQVQVIDVYRTLFGEFFDEHDTRIGFGVDVLDVTLEQVVGQII